MTSKEVSNKAEPEKEILVMKIERSCATAANAKKVQGGFWRILCLLFLVAAVGAFASPRANQASMRLSLGVAANVILVTNTNDSGPGSLREALAAANDGDTIDATGVSGTILLTSGELQITRGVTINGPGAGTLAVNGNGSSRVFENLAPDADVTISGFTITNGHGGLSSTVVPLRGSR
jgi:hypothetical protein